MNDESGPRQFEYMSKSLLLGKIQDGFDKLESALAGLSQDDLVRPGIYAGTDLAAKDLVAHVAGWAAMEAGRLEASLRGERVVRFLPGYELNEDSSNFEEVIDRLNARISAESKDKETGEIMREFHEAHARIVDVVGRLSDEDINDIHRFDWFDGAPIWRSIAGNTYGHYEEHAAEILAVSGANS